MDQEAQYTPPSVVGLPEVATRYVYNRDKQLTSITRPDGQALTLTYDTGGRVSQLTTPTGAVAYAYTPATGQLASVTAPGGGTLSHTWDGFLSTASTWAGPVTGAVQRTYNSDFDITALSVNGQAITYNYDADGLLTQAGDLSLSRNAQNGLITGTTLSTLTDTRGYNGFGELSAYAAKVGTSSVYSSSYGRDALGRIIEKTESIQNVTTKTTYTYDTAGRLTEVKENDTVVSTYAYDANGNRIQHNGTTGEIDAQDRLTRYGDGSASLTNRASYTYTANGELKTQTDASGTSTYDYDLLGNLRKVQLPNSTTIEYVIDGQKRRIGKQVNGELKQGFLYQDQLRPIAELDGNNQVVARFVYGDKANVPAYMLKGGITYRILSDHLGSPRLVIDLTSGIVVQRIDYDEFGQVLSDSNPGFQPFGFAGGLYDKDTGLVRFGARDYDAETGRWTAKDPIRFAGGDTNLFAYAINDPINLVDPLGLRQASARVACAMRAKSCAHGAHYDSGPHHREAGND